MKKTSLKINLDTEQYRWLISESRRRKCSASAVVRDLIEKTSANNGGKS